MLQLGMAERWHCTQVRKFFEMQCFRWLFAVHHYGNTLADSSCTDQKTSAVFEPFFPFFYSPLELWCSYCCAFPSALSVQRSHFWKHPQSCIFVNWDGSGNGAAARRGCRWQITWLTFQPQIWRAVTGEMYFNRTACVCHINKLVKHSEVNL